MTDDQWRALLAKDPRYAAFPRPAAPASRTPGDGQRAALPPTIAPCAHLGARVPGEPCGSPLTRCNRHGDVTARFSECKGAARCCATCPDFTRFVAQEGDPAVGVVIGSFRWPELVAVQVRTIRETCGPVPILVSNDDPESHAALAAICAAYPDVTLDTNPERMGHNSGDLAAFRKGATWGVSRGLQYVAKLSQRFIVTQPRWLHDGARNLRDAGLSAASMPTRGREVYALRTECVLMDAAAWAAPEVLAALSPEPTWGERFGGVPTETTVKRAIPGGVFWPWVSLLGDDRYRRDHKDVLWHCNTPAEEYHRLAKRFGLTLAADFHCDGWQGELAAGRYKFGW